MQLRRIDDLVFNFLLHTERHLFQRQLAQLKDVLLPEKIVQGLSRIFSGL